MITSISPQITSNLQSISIPYNQLKLTNNLLQIDFNEILSLIYINNHIFLQPSPSSHSSVNLTFPKIQLI